MKKVLYTLIFLVVVLFAFPVRAAGESIQNFDATYILNKSGLIEVEEKIQYDFGSNYRHGIYRFIPYIYKLDNGDTARINLSNFTVQDTRGNGYQFEKYTENNNVVLKIGDPNSTITGVHSYVIGYQVKGGLKYLDTGDEFYWNVNGTGWEVPVTQATATVKYPADIPQESIKYTCYTGVYGSNTKCAKAKLIDGEVGYEATNMGAGQGLTVVAGFPKGTFEVMDAGFMGSGLSSSIVAVLALVASIFPLLTFVYMLRHWWKYGRDPKGRGTIVAEYSAPDGLSPIEVGTLLDNRVDNKDLSSEIIYLATRGYLKIRREPGKGIFKKEDYTLTKLSTGKGADNTFDNTLLSGIFGVSDEVTMSSLKNEFYTNIPSIKSQVHDKLLKDQYFKSRVATTIGKYIGIAAVVGFVGFWASVGLGALTGGIGGFIFAPAFIISALIIGGFGLLMPARTAKGVEAKEKILGLKEYMSVAESDRVKFHNAPKKDPKKFEELLPYAMVLGVEKEWAKQFEGIYKGNPGWYDDPSGRIFVPLVFVNNLNSFTAVATQNMISSPSSSGSGFGGGGFGGGGFGGGGGGSW